MNKFLEDMKQERYNQKIVQDFKLKALEFFYGDDGMDEGLCFGEKLQVFVSILQELFCELFLHPDKAEEELKNFVLSNFKRTYIEKKGKNAIR